MATLPYDPTVGAPVADGDSPLPYDPARYSVPGPAQARAPLPTRDNPTTIVSAKPGAQASDWKSWPVVAVDKNEPPPAPKEGGGNAAVDFAKTAGGAALQGLGNATRGVGEASRLMATPIAAAVNAIFGTDLRAANPLANESEGGIPVADTLENKGTIEHDFVIDELNVKAHAAVGTSADATLSDLKPGTYAFYCSIAGHRQAGMEGTLVVK